MVLVGVCEHPAANAILSRWAARARERGIKTEIDASIPANLPMDEVSLTGILANSFENAVEGCLRAPVGMDICRRANAKLIITTGNITFSVFECTDTQMPPNQINYFSIYSFL